MNYNMENTLLTGEDLEKVSRIADDKLVDILTALVDSSSNTFYGEYRLNNFTKGIIDVNDRISSTDTLLRSLETKSEDELKELAKEYKVKDYEKLSKSLLLYEVEKAIYTERDTLRDESIGMANNYTANFKNTFEYFISTNINNLEKAINTEHNLDLLNKYKYLRDNFLALDYKLKALHGWLDMVTPEIEAMNEDKDEIETITKRLQDNQNKFAIGADADGNLIPFDELKQLKEQIDSDTSRLHELNESISFHKSNVVGIVNNSDIQINFSNLKMEFMENLVNIKANIQEAYDNKVLSINENDIDNVMKAFNEYFNEPVYKQFEFTNYLRENGLVMEDDKSRGLNDTFIRELRSNQNTAAVGRSNVPSAPQPVFTSSSPIIVATKEERVPVRNRFFDVKKLNESKDEYVQLIFDPEYMESLGLDPILSADSLDKGYETYKETDPVIIELREKGNKVADEIRKLIAKEITTEAELSQFKGTYHYLARQFSDYIVKINERVEELKKKEKEIDYDELYDKFLDNIRDPEYREKNGYYPLHQSIILGVSPEEMIEEFKDDPDLQLMAKICKRRLKNTEDLIMCNPKTKEQYDSFTKKFDDLLLSLSALYRDIDNRILRLKEKEKKKTSSDAANSKKAEETPAVVETKESLGSKQSEPPKNEEVTEEVVETKENSESEQPEPKKDEEKSKVDVEPVVPWFARKPMGIQPEPKKEDEKSEVVIGEKDGEVVDINVDLTSPDVVTYDSTKDTLPGMGVESPGKDGEPVTEETRPKTFKDSMINLCNSMGESVVFKVKQKKENTVEVVTSCKNKVKGFFVELGTDMKKDTSDTKERVFNFLVKTKKSLSKEGIINKINETTDKIKNKMINEDDESRRGR